MKKRLLPLLFLMLPQMAFAVNVSLFNQPEHFYVLPAGIHLTEKPAAIVWTNTNAYEFTYSIKQGEVYLVEDEAVSIFNSCDNNICTTEFPIDLKPNQFYLLELRAVNAAGTTYTSTRFRYRLE